MKRGLEFLGRPQVQAGFLLVGIFLIGGLAGAAFERTRQRPWRPPERAAARPGMLPPELGGRLRLTAAQEAAIKAILDRNKPRTDAVLNEFLPRLRSITDSVRTEIRKVLTVEQRAIFDREPPFPFASPERGGFAGSAPPGPLGEHDSTHAGVPLGHRMAEPGTGPAGGRMGPPPHGNQPPGPPPDRSGGRPTGGPGEPPPGGPGGPPPGGPGGPPPGGPGGPSSSQASAQPPAAPAQKTPDAAAARPAGGTGDATAAHRSQAEETPAAAARPSTPPAASAPSYRPVGQSSPGSAGQAPGSAGAQPGGAPPSPPPAGQPSGGPAPGGQPGGSPPPRPGR